MANSYPHVIDYTGQSVPTADPTLQQRMIWQLMQNGGSPPPGLSGGSPGPTGPPSGAGLPPIAGLPGATKSFTAPPLPGPVQQAGNAGVFDPGTGPNPGPGAGGSVSHTSGPSSSGNTGGLDPNNPIDAVFLKTGYGDRGIGSGFGDLSYWRQHPDQAARLQADQQGTGTDTPGPGDTGNTSHGTGGGGGGGGFNASNPLNLTGGDLLQQTLAGQGNDPSNTIFARIMAALQGYSGGQ